MKVYIKSSLDLPNKIKYVVDDIIKTLDSGRNVYISYGSLVDRIIGYDIIKTKDPIGNDTVLFNTMSSTSYFGSKVDLSAYSEVDIDDAGELFIVEVHP